MMSLRSMMVMKVKYLTVGPWDVAAPQPDEVRVRVEAAGISFADLLIMQGLHAERRTPPFVPGWDVVGEVESVGTHVGRVAVGDRVAALSIVGGWAEHVIVPGFRVVPVQAAFDGIGATAPGSLRAVRRGGTFVWFGIVTMLSRGQRDAGKIAKTTGVVVSVFGRNVVPGGKRVKFYSIQMLAKKHSDWYREDLSTLLTMLADGQIAPKIATAWKLDEVAAAAEGLAQGSLPGKQVIAVATR